MAKDEEVGVGVRLKGGRAFISEARGVSGSITGIGKAARTTQRTFRPMSDAAGSALGAISRATRYTVAGVGALGVAGAVAGVKFNMAFQDATTSFTTFLGSADKAQAFIENLRSVSNASPFRLTEFMDASRVLLGFGVAADKVTPLLDSLNSAVIASGGSAENINRAAIALGQMSAKGKISAEELNQLREAGINVNDILQKELGLTGEQVGNIGKYGVDAGKGLDAITRGLKTKYGKAAENASNNLSLQLARGRKDIEQFLRVANKPLFDWLNKSALPPALKTLQKGIAIFESDMSTKWKLKRLRKVIDQELGPIWRDIVGWWRRNDVGGKIQAFIRDTVTPAIAKALAAGAPVAIRTFISGIVAAWGAGWGGKALLVGLAWKSGALGTLWRILELYAGRRKVPVTPGPAIPGGGKVSTGRKIAQLGRYGLGAGLIGVGVGALAVEGAAIADPGNATLNRRLKERGATHPGILPGRFPGAAQRRAMGGPVSAGRSYVVGEHRPELFTPEASGHISPSVPSGNRPQVIQVMVGRKVLAEALVQETADESARRYGSKG